MRGFCGFCNSVAEDSVLLRCNTTSVCKIWHFEWTVSSSSRADRFWKTVPKMSGSITVDTASCPTTTNSNYRWCSIMPHNNKFQLLLIQHHAPQQQIPVTTDAASSPTTTNSNYRWCSIIPKTTNSNYRWCNIRPTISSNYQWCSIMPHNKFQLPVMQYHVPQ